MQRWILKTAIQQAISVLPWSYRWNEYFQRYVTKGLFLKPEAFEAKLRASQTHLENYRSLGTNSDGSFAVLELGTGWFPTVPLGLYVCGASTIWTYDIVPVLRRFTFKQTLDRFAEFSEAGRLAELLPEADSDRIKRVLELRSRAEDSSPAELLAELGIYVRIGDARQTGLKTGSLDLVFSTFALEHIDPSILAGLLREFRRVIREGGVMCHYIGLKDQYADFDSTLSPFNFLKYSERQWRLLNNRMIPLTRLRIADYRKLIAEAGFEIVRELNTRGDVADLRRVPLATEFQNYSEEDLLVLFSWLAARPSPDMIRRVA